MCDININQLIDNGRNTLVRVHNKLLFKVVYREKETDVDD